ncbi:MAG: hypothetical protein ACRDQA_23910, partial [Nocardioidaceae bacterium]
MATATIATASVAVWDGHRHDQGQVFTCTLPDSIFRHTLVWLPTSKTTVDPAALAHRAVQAMNLHAVGIGLAPPAGHR